MSYVKIGVAGPVGSGKTALIEALSRKMAKDYSIGVITNDIYTKEGTLVIPAATTMKAVITDVTPKKWWNKNDKVAVEFQSMTLPTGVCVPFNAEVINNNGILTENRWAKPLGYTVGGAVVGAGAGVGIAGFTGHHHYGNGVAIGTPVGAGLGLLTGLTTKGRTYKANDGDYVWLELTQDLSIPN